MLKKYLYIIFAVVIIISTGIIELIGKDATRIIEKHPLATLIFFYVLLLFIGWQHNEIKKEEERIKLLSYKLEVERKRINIKVEPVTIDLSRKKKKNVKILLFSLFTLSCLRITIFLPKELKITLSKKSVNHSKLRFTPEKGIAEIEITTQAQKLNIYVEIERSGAFQNAEGNVEFAVIAKNATPAKEKILIKF